MRRDAIRRRRRCVACEKRFTTWETAELRPPQIVKSNGTREDFDEKKLREGFRRALHKRPVSTELVDAAVKDVNGFKHVVAQAQFDVALQPIVDAVAEVRLERWRQAVASEPEVAKRLQAMEMRGDPNRALKRYRDQRAVERAEAELKEWRGDLGPVLSRRLGW